MSLLKIFLTKTPAGSLRQVLTDCAQGHIEPVEIRALAS